MDLEKAPLFSHCLQPSSSSWLYMGSFGADEWRVNFLLQLGWLECPSYFHQLLAWSVMIKWAFVPSSCNGCHCEEATLKHDLIRSSALNFLGLKNNTLANLYDFNPYFPFWKLRSFLLMQVAQKCKTILIIKCPAQRCHEKMPYFSVPIFVPSQEISRVINLEGSFQTF